jgi:hypothetical protein
MTAFGRRTSGRVQSCAGAARVPPAYFSSLIVLPIALASYRTSFRVRDGCLPFSVAAAIGPAMSPRSIGRALMRLSGRNGPSSNCCRPSRSARSAAGQAASGLAIAVADTHPLEELPSTTDLRANSRLQSLTWFVTAAPRGTPRTIVEQISTDVAAAMKSPSVTGRLKTLSLTVVESKSAEASSFVEKEAQRWHKVIDLIGLQPE